jgi:hypothetical protein
LLEKEEADKYSDSKLGSRFPDWRRTVLAGWRCVCRVAEEACEIRCVAEFPIILDRIACE